MKKNVKKNQKVAKKTNKKEIKPVVKKKKLRVFLKVFVVICLLVLILDIIFVLYTKNKNDKNKVFFNSLNSYVEYKDNYYGVGSNNLNEKAYEKATIIKYNSNYKEKWRTTYNSKYNSTFYNVKNDGKYILAVGSYEKTKEDNKESLRTALFVKYDTEGNIIFEKELQKLGNSKFVNLIVVDDGYIVVGQSIYPNNVLGNEGDGGAIIIKYSKSGKVIWQKNIGGNKSGLFNDVIKSGKYLYAVGKDAARYGILVKYNLKGEEIKSVSYAKTDTIGFSSIVKVKDKLIVVGAKKVNKEDEYDHDINGLIVEYNEELEKTNEVIYKDDKNGLERFNKVILNDNSLIVIGHEAVLDKKKSTKEENVYYYKGIIGKYETNLKKVKVYTYHEDNDDYFTDIKVISGNYVISGYKKYTNNKYKNFFIGYNKDLK